MIGIPNFMGIRFSGGPLSSRYLLYGWGANKMYVLEQPSTLYNKPASRPINVGSSNIINWKYVSVGSGFNTDRNQIIASRINGTLWGWGYNSHGQVGVNRSTSSISRITQIGALTDWNKPFAGHYCSFAIKTDGTLWAWGIRSNGRLGDGFGSGTVSSPIQVGSSSDWERISPFGAGAIAIKTDKSLWGWGNNSQFELGSGDQTTVSTPVQIGLGITGWNKISSGYNFSIAIKTDGTLWAWGNGSNGKLGLRDTNNRSVPTQIGANTDWSQIDCGREHALAVKTNGTIWAWGYNIRGQLGIQNTTSQSSPVQIGTGTTGDWVVPFGTFRSSFALKSDSTIWAWGYNNNSALGRGVSQRYCEFPVKIDPGTTSNWAFAANSDTNSGSLNFAIKTDGTLWAWGINGLGGLGVGDAINKTSPTQVGTGVTGDWTMVASGRYFGAALKSNGTLWTWGRNNYGQLGHNNTTNFSSPVQVGIDTDWLHVRCGRYHVAATKTNGTLWTWGRNNYGQLGHGNTTIQSSPVQVGTGTTGPWVEAICGQYHTFAKTSTNVLWAWGRNNYRQLGVGNVASLSSPTQLTGNNNSDWLSVSSKQSTTLAVKNNGTVWGWGSAINGILGARFAESNSPIQLFTSTGWTGAETLGPAAIGLKTDNTIWSWGSQANGYGGLGFFRGGPTSVPVQQGTKNNWSFIAKTVGNNGIAIDADGLLWTWGDRRGSYGGLGGVNHISSPVQVGSSLTGWQPNTLISGLSDNMLMIRKLG